MNSYEESNKATLEERLRLLFGIQCMQTAWEDLYYFIIKNSDKLSNEFLQGLKDDKRFQSEPDYGTLMGKISPEDVYKMTDFMGVFYNTMQLKSDNNAAISQQEIWNLIELVQFSSITSRDSSIVQESAPKDYDWNQVKSVAVKVSQHLNGIYNVQLNEYRGYVSGFGFWPVRWGVNAQHEKFRINLKIFWRSDAWLAFNFFLEEGILAFNVYSNHLLLKAYLKEIVESINLHTSKGYIYDENNSLFLVLWRKAVPDYSSENIVEIISEMLKTDLDKIFPLFLEKIQQILLKNPTRINFLKNIRERVLNKLPNSQSWVLENDHIVGNGISLFFETCEPEGEDDNGYGSWWGVYDQSGTPGIPFGLAQSHWEGFVINGINDFKDFISGNMEMTRLEQSLEIKEQVLESISDDIVQKVKMGLANYKRTSDEN